MTRQIDKTEPSEAAARLGRRIAVTVVGTVAGLASMLLVLGVMVYANRDHGALSSQVQTSPQKIEQLRELQAADRKLLDHYTIDQATGQIRIPIQRAMELIVADEQARQGGATQ